MKNLRPSHLLSVVFLFVASFHVFGEDLTAKVPICSHYTQLATDTTGLRQLIDSTERLVDERMFAEAQLLLDQILAISERELGRVSRETADILHQMARIQNFKYTSRRQVLGMRKNKNGAAS